MMVLAAVLIAENDLRNDAGCHCDQDIIWTSLHPLITARWRMQPVTAPVIDYILAAAVFMRNAIALVKVMPWTCAATIVPFMSSIIMATRLLVSMIALMPAILAVPVMLTMGAATTIIAVIPALCKSGAGCRQSQCQDGRDNDFAFHRYSLVIALRIARSVYLQSWPQHHLYCRVM
jgi:hypothetical protein